MNAHIEKEASATSIKNEVKIEVNEFQITSDTSKNQNFYQDYKDITPIHTYGNMDLTKPKEVVEVNIPIVAISSNYEDKSLYQTNNFEVAEHSIDIKPIPIENGTQAHKDNATMDSGISLAKMSALCKRIQRHWCRIIMITFALYISIKLIK